MPQPKFTRPYRTSRPVIADLRVLKDGSVIVPLTRGKAAVIDSDDADIVLTFLWQARPNSRSWTVATAVRGDDGKQHILKLSRLLTNAPADLQVDHKNGNPLDNRKTNLRFATSNQNNHNRAVSVRSISGYKGVSVTPRGNRWLVNIKVADTNHYLGSFRTPEDAARAYDTSAVELQGEFARLNFRDRVFSREEIEALCDRVPRKEIGPEKISHRQRWTAEDDDMVERHDRSMKEIAEQLGRTVNAVKGRRRDLRNASAIG